jgi:hypothetical protein
MRASKLIVPLVGLSLILTAATRSTAAEAEKANNEIKDLAPNQVFSATVPRSDTQFKFHIQTRSDVRLSLSQPTEEPCRPVIKDEKSSPIGPAYYKSSVPGRDQYSSSVAGYSLNPGNYLIEFSCWSLRSKAPAHFSVSYALTPLAELPSEAVSFNRWLFETGLQKHINMIGFYYVQDDQTISTSRSPWVSKDEAEAIAARLKDHLRNFRDDGAEPPKPTLFLVLHSEYERDMLESFVEKMRNLFDDNLVEKFARTAAGFSGQSVQKVAVSLSGYCISYSGIYYKHSFIDKAVECLSSSVGVSLPDEGTRLTSRSVVPLTDHVGLIANFEKRLNAYFTTRMGKIQIIDREVDYLEIVAKGMRGLVIPGNADWERIQITISLLGSGNDRRLRLGADGFLGSGLRPPVSDQGYDRSMEPDYAQALTLFVRTLATQLRTFDRPLD